MTLLKIDRTLLRFIIRRTLLSIITLFGLSLLIFTIARVLPGDPARMALGPRAPEWAIESFRAELHLSEPLYVQYYYWVQGALTGDLGTSIVTRRNVMTDIIEFFPATLELVLLSTLITTVLSILIGALAGRHPNTWIDNTARLVSYIGVSVPSFVFAIIFLLIFGYILNILPTMGRISPGLVRPLTLTGMITVDAVISLNFPAFFDTLKHMIMPAIAMGLGSLAQEARITRSNIIENVNKDYMQLAISQGLPERTIWKYLLKPSLIPTVSVMGLDTAARVSNAFLVELIFNWPGLSRYGIGAILNKDLNAIVGVVMMLGLVFVVVNLIVDIIVARLDPRIPLMK